MLDLYVDIIKGTVVDPTAASPHGDGGSQSRIGLEPYAAA
jgi:hypothetical protein